MEHVKKLTSHSIIYGLPGFLNQFIAIFLLPIYTSFLSPAEVGALALLTTISAILYTSVSVGMGSAVFRSYFFEKEKNRSLVISTSFFFMTVFPLFIITPLIFLSPWISELVFKTSDYSLALRFSFVGIYFNALLLIPYAFFRAREKPITYVSVTITQLLGNLLFSILYVVLLDMGITGAILGNFSGSLIALIVSLFLVVPALTPKFSKRILSDMLSFGLPLLPAAFAMWGLNVSDRFFLQYFHGLESVGFYNVGYRIGQIISLFVGAFQLAWAPFIFKIAKEKNAKQTYSTVTEYYFILIILMVLLVTVFSKPILIILTPSFYWNSFVLVAPVALAYLFYGMYYLFAVGINLEKKTIYMVYVVISGFFTNVLFNLLLIPTLGSLGAAISTMISFAILMFLSFIFSNRYYQIPYNWGKMLLIGILFIVSVGSDLLLLISRDAGLYLSIISGVFSVLIFITSLFIFKFVDKSKIFLFIKSFSVLK